MCWRRDSWTTQRWRRTSGKEHHGRAPQVQLFVKIFFRLSVKCCAQLCAIYLSAGFLQAMELPKLSTKMDKKVEQMNVKVFVSTRPKLAYGQQSLD